MIFCDPAGLGVVSAPLHSRVTLPGKPWSRFGAVREVHFNYPDLSDPLNCLCFSQNEMGEVLGYSTGVGKASMSQMVKKGKLPRPMWAACDLYGAPTGLRTMRIQGYVYTLPEAEVLHIAWQCANRDYDGIKRDLTAIRDQLGETIE